MLKKKIEISDQILKFTLYKRLKHIYLVDKVNKNFKLICIIESARIKKIVGYNYKPTEWIAFANNAIHAYSEYWDYIELAFKQFELWDFLIKLDKKKKSFQKKLQDLYEKSPNQNYDFDDVFIDLYPELSSLR